MNPSDYNTNRRNFVNAASEKLKSKFAAQHKADAFTLICESIENEVKATIRPILQAGGAAKPDDLEALRFHVLKECMERFHAQDKNFLVLFSATQLASSIIDQIQNDPWGSGHNDKLSGQDSIT